MFKDIYINPCNLIRSKYINFIKQGILNIN